jgi:Flp pilus assembly protein TadG
MVTLHQRIRKSRLVDQLGSVTAELALALPAVSLVIAVTLGAFSLQIERMKLVDVAAMAARAMARGESQEDIRTQVYEMTTSGADASYQLSFEVRENMSCVILSRQFQLAGLRGELFDISELQCARKMGL